MSKNILVDKLLQLEKTLSTFFVERSDEIHGINLATISGKNILFLGPPGTGKSNLVTAYHYGFAGAKRFEKLLTKFTTPEEIFGPFSLKALENDEYHRQLEGYLAEAHFAFIDETFKSSSALLNSLLTVMNERKFTNGKVTMDIPLLTLVGASNEIPEEADGLSALFDRFHLKYMVKPIQERSNRIKILMAQSLAMQPILTLDELYKAKQEVKNIKFGLEAAEMYAKVIDKLVKEGLSATDRTYRTSIDVLKAEAYLNGRTEVKQDDFDILQHVLWTDPDERKKVYNIILTEVNPDKTQILKLWEAANEVYGNITKTADKNEQMKAGVEAANKLKDIKNKLHDFLTIHKKDNKDTTLIKKYEDEVDTMLTDVFKTYLGVSHFS